MHNQHISVSVCVSVSVLQIAFHMWPMYHMYNTSSDLWHFCREGDLARPWAMALPRVQSPWGTQFTNYRDVWHVTHLHVETLKVIILIYSVSRNHDRKFMLWCKVITLTDRTVQFFMRKAEGCGLVGDFVKRAPPLTGLWKAIFLLVHVGGILKWYMNHVWMIVFYCPVVFVTARQNAARAGEQSKASRSQITYTRMI